MDKTGVKLGHVVQIHVCRLAQIGTTRTATKNGKKTIGLISKTTTLHVHHTSLYISFPFLHDYGVKMSKFAFYGGRKQAKSQNYRHLYGSLTMFQES